MRSVAEIVVDRPLEVVWRWAADPRNWENWLDGVRDVRVEGRLVEGGRIASRYEYSGRLHDFEYEIVVRDPPRRRLRSLEGPFPFESDLELSEHTRGTRPPGLRRGPGQPLHRLPVQDRRPLLQQALRRRMQARSAASRRRSS